MMMNRRRRRIITPGLIFPGAGGVVAPTTFSGFKIKIPHNNWVELSEINMTDHDDNEFFVALTALTESEALTYGDVSPGEFATDSTYGAVTTRANLNNGLPDITNPTSTQGGVEWSSSGSTGLEVYVKPTTPKSLKILDMSILNSYGDPIGVVQVTDGDDNVLTPTTPPADINDVYQTTGNATRNWYRWIYPTNPEA